MIKNKFLQFVLYVVVFVLVWNVLDYLWELILPQDASWFTVSDNVVKPLLLGVILSWVIPAYIRKKAQKKQK